MPIPAALATRPMPDGLTPKAQRAWKFLAEHEQRMAAKRGLREFRCGECQAVIAHYVPPNALFLWPCHLCGYVNKLSTSLNGGGG
jgi:hypothetical protein